jgi:hypothetical protein
MNHVVKFFVFFCPAQKKDEFDASFFRGKKNRGKKKTKSREGIICEFFRRHHG